MNVTVDEVREIIANAETMADMDTLKNDIALTDQEVDSLDMANILLLIEEKYQIKIPNEDTNKLQTVDAIVDYLNKV